MFPRQITIRGRLALLALSSTWLCGCGSTGPTFPTAEVSGKVTLAGAPLPDDAEGTVTLMPAQSGGQASPASSPIVAGKYRIEGAPLGEVRALFNITRLTGRMVREDNVPTASPHEERENLVPEKSRQGIVIEIEGDDPGCDFDL